VRPGGRTVPLAVDARMFVAFGLGVSDCRKGQRRCKRNAPVFAGSMNNASFVLPAGGVPLLEAHFRNVSGVFTRDFPAEPPVPFDYTKPPARLRFTAKSTRVKTLRYNSTVEVVLQNTALVARESHPMHLHGFNFFVLAQGFGNFHQAAAADKRYNLVNPQERNTVAVPPGGWAVIRFVADNPGTHVRARWNAELRASEMFSEDSD
jgi:laccase